MKAIKNPIEIQGKIVWSLMSSVEIWSGLYFLDVYVMQLINVLCTLSEQGWLFGRKDRKLLQ